MNLQGRDTPAHKPHDPDAPHGGGGGGGGRQRPQKPARHKPTPAKPAHHRPAAHKRAPAKPSKPGKRTVARGEMEAIELAIVFMPLAKGGHIH